MDAPLHYSFLLMISKWWSGPGGEACLIRAASTIVNTLIYGKAKGDKEMIEKTG